MYKDKEKQKAYAAKHYLENRSKMLAKAAKNNKISKVRNREFIKNYLSTHPCVDCDNSDIRVLDFDHVRGIKFKNLANMTSSYYSIKTIQEEIDKCEVRCANCHRIATCERRNSGLN